MAEQEASLDIQDPTQQAVPEDKNKRYRLAAEYNAVLLHQRHERGAFYFEPHTKSVQVLPSWIVKYNSNWAAPRAPIVRLHEQQQQLLQKQMQQQLIQQQQQQQRQIADQQLQSMQQMYQQQQNMQQIYQQNQQQQQQQQKEQPQQEFIVYDENGDIVNKPRPAITAFIHYSMTVREQLKKQHPGMNITDLSKVMGVKWRAMSESEHKPYMDKAREEKRRVDKELEEYQKKLKLFQQNPHWATKKAGGSAAATPATPTATATTTDEQRAQSVASPTSPTQQQNKKDEAKPLASIKCESCGGKPQDPSQLIPCATCAKTFHPACIHGLPASQEKIKQLGNWKCIDCKMCEICNDPGNEDKLMICDSCDAGYHTYCLSPPLNRPPQGGWKCHNCVQCIHCGARTPGAGASCKWRANYTACDSCHQLYTDNKFCPVCEIVYRFNEKRPMVECEGCSRWVHVQCDGIDEDTYRQMSGDDVHYNCPVCRKEKPDPSDRIRDDKESQVVSSKMTRRAGERRKRRRADDDFVDIEAF